MWGFLSEFWNAITGVGEYTIEFFRNIGLAVAGAVGNLFDYLLHNFHDLFVFLGWLFDALKQLVFSLTLPISYIGSFLKSFVVNATATPVQPEASYTFSTSTLSVFLAIPYWETISLILGVGILIIVSVGILHLILRV